MAVKGAQIGIQLPHSFVGVAGDQSVVHKGASLLIELDRTDQPSGILWEEFVKGIAVFGFYQGVDHFDDQMIIALAQQIGRYGVAIGRADTGGQLLLVEKHCGGFIDIPQIQQGGLAGRGVERRRVPDGSGKIRKLIGSGPG